MNPMKCIKYGLKIKDSLKSTSSCQDCSGTLQSARVQAGSEGYFLNVKSSSLAKGVYKLYWLLGQSALVSQQGRRAQPELTKVTGSARRAQNQSGPEWFS